jgi:hypothetical protein
MICILTFIYMNENGIWRYSNYWIMCGALWFLIWRWLTRTFQLHVFFSFSVFTWHQLVLHHPDLLLLRQWLSDGACHRRYAGYEAAAALMMPCLYFFSFTILFLRFTVLRNRAIYSDYIFIFFLFALMVTIWWNWLKNDPIGFCLRLITWTYMPFGYLICMAICCSSVSTGIILISTKLACHTSYCVG